NFAAAANSASPQQRAQILAWNIIKRGPCRQARECQGMPNARLVGMGGTVLFLVASSAGFAQVPMLNRDDAPGRAGIGTVQRPDPTVRPSPESAPNSSIVTGPESDDGTVPIFNLDKFLSEPSAPPTANSNAAEKH